MRAPTTAWPKSGAGTGEAVGIGIILVVIGVIPAILAAPVTAMITGTDTLSAAKRAELRGRISTMPGLNRFLRTTPVGLLRIDKTKIASEANLDGSTCCAARTRTCPRRTSRWATSGCCRSNGAGGT